MKVSVCPNCYEKERNLYEGRHIVDIVHTEPYRKISVYECLECEETYEEHS